MDDVADGGLGAGEVGVRLVVGAADEFDLSAVQQQPQGLAALGVLVEVGLQVVDFGEDERVHRIPQGEVQVGVDEREAVALPERAGGGVCGEQLPRGGVGGLGVPPDRVVVEVRDQEHRPAGFGDFDQRLHNGALRPDGDREPVARPGLGVDLQRDFDQPRAGRLTADARAADGDPGGRAADRHPQDLARVVLGADEQVGALDGGDGGDRHGEGSFRSGGGYWPQASNS